MFDYIFSKYCSIHKKHLKVLLQEDIYNWKKNVSKDDNVFLVCSFFLLFTLSLYYNCFLILIGFIIPFLFITIPVGKRRSKDIANHEKEFLQQHATELKSFLIEENLYSKFQIEILLVAGKNRIEKLSGRQSIKNIVSKFFLNIFFPLFTIFLAAYLSKVNVFDILPLGCLTLLISLLFLNILCLFYPDFHSLYTAKMRNLEKFVETLEDIELLFFAPNSSDE